MGVPTSLNLLFIFCLLFTTLLAAVEDEYIVWPTYSTPEMRIETAKKLVTCVRREIIETVSDEFNEPEFWVLHKPTLTELASLSKVAEVSLVTIIY